MANNPNNMDNLVPFENGEDERRKNSGRKPTRFLTDLLTKNLEGDKEIVIEGTDYYTGLPTKIRVTMPTKDTIMQALLRQASKGNMIAIKEIFDRMEGRAMQPIEVGGEGGGPIQHIITGMIIT